MMKFVYHMVPKEMRGKILIPLNALKKEYPDLYIKYTKKYFDHPERPKLLTKHIPKLNCLWNDVLHFLPLHPHFVFNALTDLGIKTKEKQEFYKIPIEKLSDNVNVMYHYSKEKYKGPASEIAEREIEIVHIKDYQELMEIPSSAETYYRIEKQKGNKMGLFSYIPHLLSLGEIDVSDVEKITWDHL